MFQFSNLLRREAEAARRKLTSDHGSPVPTDNHPTGHAADGTGSPLSDRVRRELDEQMERLTKLLDYVESLESVQDSENEPLEAIGPHLAEFDASAESGADDTAFEMTDDDADLVVQFPETEWPAVDSSVTLPEPQGTTDLHPELDTLVLELETPPVAELIFESNSIIEQAAETPPGSNDRNDRSAAAAAESNLIKLAKGTEPDTARQKAGVVSTQTAARQESRDADRSKPAAAAIRRPPQSCVDHAGTRPKRRQRLVPIPRLARESRNAGRSSTQGGGLVQDFTAPASDDESPTLEILDIESNPADGSTTYDCEQDRPASQASPIAGDSFAAPESATNQDLGPADSDWDFVQSVVETSQVASPIAQIISITPPPSGVVRLRSSPPTSTASDSRPRSADPIVHDVRYSPANAGGSQERGQSDPVHQSRDVRQSCTDESKSKSVPAGTITPSDRTVSAAPPRPASSRGRQSLSVPARTAPRSDAQAAGILILPSNAQIFNVLAVIGCLVALTTLAWIATDLARWF